MLVEIPVSVGELIDKITILEIKYEKTGSDDIFYQLETLKARATPEMLKTKHRGILRGNNERLWELEDELRAAMRQYQEKEADAEPIREIATWIACTNDRRCKLKGDIDEQFGTEPIKKIYQVD